MSVASDGYHFAAHYNCKYGPFINHDGDGNEDEANKRFNEQNNNSVPAFEDRVYFLAVLGKIGTLSKPRRRQQRGHGKTKDLIGRAIAQHVLLKTLYIS